MVKTGTKYELLATNDIEDDARFARAGGWGNFHPVGGESLANWELRPITRSAGQAPPLNSWRLTIEQ